jgi:hypothetical protein
VPSRARLTGRDLELLAFVAEHRFVLPAHAETLLDAAEAAVQRRLARLVAGGLLIREPGFGGQPPAFRSSRAGLDAVGSRLRPLAVNVGCYEHDVGVAWLWLAARNGAFGPVRRLFGERQMRSRDAGDDQRDEPFAMRLGGTGRGGKERLHYPDLLIVDRRGRRIALELDLTPKSRVRRERILAGYASDTRTAAVVYLVYKPQLARAIGISAARLGISQLVHVHRVGPPETARAATRTPARAIAVAHEAGR